MAAAISEKINASIHPNGLLALAGEITFASIDQILSMGLPTGITTPYPERTGDIQPPPPWFIHAATRC